MLGRIAVCHAWGWTLEADPCLLEAAVEKLGMSDSKGISTPGHKEEPADGACDIRSRRMDPRPLHDPDSSWPGFDASPKLDQSELKKFQSVAALLNFVSLDRPELLYSVKELMRRMACASAQDLSGLKRVVRFVRTLPRVVARYPWKELPSHI